MRVRVLIVDDSVVVRKLLSETLGSCAELEVCGTASNGAIAMAKIPILNPDVLTLDIEMPGMDGIQTLVEIRKQYPRLPVIMCSTLTERGAAITLEALSLGASDYVTKPSNSDSLAGAMEQMRRELLTKILTLTVKSRSHTAARSPALRIPKKTEQRSINIVAIGSSTGGPNALAEVIPQLPADFPVPIVVVQHMPPLFTRFLAERLNGRSGLAVHEGEAGKQILTGSVWIAPGDFHMTVERKGTAQFLGLNQQPPENSCRPAVDVLFRSVADVYGPNVLGVVLTGMGLDGARGAMRVREAGGSVIVQDEATSVVWGMPGAVVSAGAADHVSPLKEIALEIIRRVNFGRTRTASAPFMARG